ncbi:hypothetical protein BJY04DRAFT_219359 [Aspergillus karnatakaensis]|uniref:antibiotic biosynthesis monooxygenase family protein n=1 Tax=Aspergillus karnatakaensis TaxID=1810916 RepID=UPI003CCD69E2
MPRPVTEVVTIPVQPDENLEQAIKRLKAILSRQQGFQYLKWGRWVQEMNKVQLIIGWDDISYHERFKQSDSDSTAAEAALRPVLAGAPMSFHVYFDPIALEEILEAPIVEVATFFSVPEDYSYEAEIFLKLLGSFRGGLGFLHADVVENISADGSDPKGRGLFVLLAWASIDLHVQAKESDVIQSNLHLIKGEGKTNEIEWHYVTFTEP